MNPSAEAVRNRTMGINFRAEHAQSHKYRSCKNIYMRVMSTAHARKAIDHQNKVSRFQMFGYEPALR
jgi:hypothetical protein